MYSVYNCDSWFDHLEKSFSKEGQVKMFCLPINPAGNVNETPGNRKQKNNY